MKKDCLDEFSKQINVLLPYLRARPLLTAELNKVRTVPSSPDGLLSQLQNIVSFLSRLSPPDVSVRDCVGQQHTLRGYSCDSACSNINTAITYIFREKPFDAIVAIANNLLATLQSEYAADVKRYSDWRPYAKHYEQQAQFENIKDRYESAYRSDPEQFLHLRPEFLRALSVAEQFEAKLLDQQRQLVALDAQVTDLLPRSSREPISKIDRDLPSNGLKLRDDVAQLRDISPMDRGDVSGEIDNLINRKTDFERALSVAEQFEAKLLDQQRQLVALDAQVRDLLARSTREPISKMIDRDSSSNGQKLRDDVAQLRDISPMDRGDVSGEVAQLTNRKTDFESQLNAGQATIDNLTKKTSELASLAEQVSRIISNEELRDFINANTISSAQALLKRVADLRSLDLWVIKNKRDELSAVAQQLQDLEPKLASDKAKYDAASILETKREFVTAKSATILTYFVQPQIRSRLSSNGGSVIDDLIRQNNALSQLTAVRLSDREDYSDKLTAAESTLEKTEKIKAEVEQVLQLGEDLKTLKGKIAQRGRDLLDAGTSSQLVELESAISALSTMGAPFSDEDASRLANARVTANDMLGKIDDVLERGAKRKEIVRKGQEYASKKETTWKLVTKRNEMTDKVDQTSVSIQGNGNGVVAQVTGFCEEGEAKFSALVADEEGKPTIDLPVDIDALGVAGTKGAIRINETQPVSRVFRPRSNFRNELLLVSLAQSAQASKNNALLGLLTQFWSPSLQPIALAGIWRIYVQFETSHGSILIKIPIYDSVVQEMISSCGLQ